MLTKIPARDSEAVYKDQPPSGSARHPQGPGAGVFRSPVQRLKAIAYLTLLLAVIPALTCIATGRAGMPNLFSTVCGVVSCAAGDGAL
ncbi:hypothetical protein [Janthinobacterium sp. MDB2-8]|uniref:hypothetical protein n=1 Tax=Janthinobacterium sp. MDB2-8 TaxID=1259338 RepID=UPI003F24AAED